MSERVYNSAHERSIHSFFTVLMGAFLFCLKNGLDGLDEKGITLGVIGWLVSSVILVFFIAYASVKAIKEGKKYDKQQGHESPSVIGIKQKNLYQRIIAWLYKKSGQT